MIIGPKLVQQPGQASFSFQTGHETTEQWICDDINASSLYLYLSSVSNTVHLENRGGYSVVTTTMGGRDASGALVDPPAMPPTVTGQEVHRDIWLHPNYRGIPSAIRACITNGKRNPAKTYAQIDDEILVLLSGNTSWSGVSAVAFSPNFDKYTAAATTNELKNIEICRVAQKIIYSGQDSFKVKSYTIRAQQLLSRLSQAELVLDDDHKLFSTNALLEVIPDPILFSIPTEYDAVVQSDDLQLAYGWFKNPSQLTLLGNRMYLAEQSWQAAWVSTYVYNNLRYSSAGT